MKKFVCSLMVGAFAMFADCGFAAGESVFPLKETTSPALADVDAAVAKGVTDKVYPGAVLVIGKPGEILWAKCYGHQTYETTSPKVTFDTLYDMASCSKVMGPTAATMKLVEDGKLDLSEPVTKYLPDYGQNGKEKSQLMHLMTHTSGQPAYLVHAQIQKIVDAGKEKALKANEALVAHFCAMKPSADPGTTYTYSCLNMQTMAAIDEKVAGMPLQKYLREGVWGECGMKDTTYFPTAAQIKRTAPTIADKDGNVTRVGIVHDPMAKAYISADSCSGNAGVFSTANDCAKFCAMIAGKGTFEGKQVFKPSTIEEMTTVRTAPGLTKRTPGWGVSDATKLNDKPGAIVISHTGYTGTMEWIDTRTGTYMVLLTNRCFPDDKANVTPVRNRVIRTILRSNPEYAAVMNGR